MIKHDEQRYQGFAQLADCSGDQDFLARLKAVYASLGIGSGLDFAGLEQAWLQGSELPLEWRRELASQTPFDREAHQEYRAFNAAQRLQMALFQGEATAQWIARGHNLVVLCAPLVRPATLGYVLKYDGHWVEADRHNAYDATLGAGLRQWAEQLATGQGEWAALSHWLRAAGSDPAQLVSELSPSLGPISIDSVMECSGLRQVLVLAREQLLLGERSADTWIDLLLVHLTELDFVWSLRRLPVPLGVAHLCVRPLLQVLVTSPRWPDLLLGKSHDDDYLARKLFNDLAIGALLVEPPQRFAQVVAGIGDSLLQGLQLSEGFSQLYPEHALLFEQQRYARTGELTPRLTSPEGQDWYLSLLGEVKRYPFEALLNRLRSSCDSERLHQAISQHLCPREEQSFPSELLEQLDNVDHLYSYLSAANERLRELTAHRLFELATVRQIAEKDEDDDEDDGDKCAEVYAKHPSNWPMLLKASEAYPSLFIDTLSSWGHFRDDLARWELIWNKVEGEERMQVAKHFMRSARRNRRGNDVLDIMERLYAEDPEAWRACVLDEYASHLDSSIEAIGQRNTPILRLLPLMAARFLSDSNGWFGGGRKPQLRAVAIDGVRRALQTYPETYAELEEKARIKLLQLFDDATVLACTESLATLFASSSKLLREPAVALIGRLSPATLEASGWLTAVPKARKLVLIGLALAPQPALLELVSRYFKDKAHDDYSRGLSLDALERAGQSLSGLDPWAEITLAALQEQAVRLKIPAAVSKYWNDEFAAVLAPLGDALGLQLLHLLFEGTETMPRRARQLLQHLPAGRRSDLAWLGVQQWIAANGAVELDWMLLPLSAYGDERVANDLAKAIKDWKKARKQKASAAMRLLCQLPGNYGVSVARDLWESGKFSESIDNAAKTALSEAAERQGMTLEEFLEQLVPDFGLTHQGLVLDVGPYRYTVRMRPDLSLVVFDDKGKASKSLPKAKAGEDADKRSVADNQYKALAKNLKPVFKQQSKRLTRLFQLGSSWPAATWQKLFIDHPLMAVIAQSVVWSAEDGEGQALKRFRPAEGGELIDLDDEPYSLPADAVVHATHPLELDAAERNAWQQHFADYKLESPIEQWTTPVLVPSADVLAADHLALAKGKVLNRGKFGSLVDKWGYIKGQAGDGAQVREHTWLIDGGRWLVTLNHGNIDVYFDADATLELDTIEVHRRGEEGFERQRLGELPPAFLNTLLIQAAALHAQAL